MSKGALFKFPDTYVSRTKRAPFLIPDEEILDVADIENRLLAEFGDNVCVYEKICVKYADRALRRRSRERVLNSDEVFRYDTNTDDDNVVVVVTDFAVAYLAI